MISEVLPNWVMVAEHSGGEKVIFLFHKNYLKNLSQQSAGISMISTDDGDRILNMCSYGQYLG